MFKKIMLGTVLVLIVGGLVFGAVNRTLAKNNTGSSSSEVRIGPGSGRVNNSTTEESIISGDGLGRYASSSSWTASGLSNGRQGNGQGANGTGGMEALPPATPGDLSAAEAAALAYMREEEKLAHDVYIALYQQWNLPVFQNIANSEQTHTNAIKDLLDRYELADPASAEVGVFANPKLQALYTQLVAQGSTSMAEALKVGAVIEEIDILDLNEAQVDNADIQQVFANLRKGSENHLRAFTSQLLKQTGEAYQPQYLSPEAYQIIVGNSTQPGNGYGKGGGQRGGGGGQQP